MGTVQSIQAFGAFVEMDGFRSNGLVHISQLASYKVESVEDAVTAGERVWVKVILIKDDDEKGRRQISLSMKYVDQSDGNDLDPLHEGAQADAENRKPPSNQNDDSEECTGPTQRHRATKTTTVTATNQTRGADPLW